MAFIACDKATMETLKKEELVQEEKIYNFPEDWIGHYSGNLEIYSKKGLSQSVQMQLTIGAKDSSDMYQWKMQYGEEDIRNYAIKMVDQEAGHYVMDEFNGLFLDGYHLGNTFTSHFSVESVEITSIYKKEGNQLSFQIISSGTDTLRSNTTIEEGMEFKASSFQVHIYQYAKLEKEKTLSK